MKVWEILVGFSVLLRVLLVFVLEWTNYQHYIKYTGVGFSSGLPFPVFRLKTGLYGLTAYIFTNSA